MSSSKRIKVALSRSLSKCPNKRCPSNINKCTEQQSIVQEHNAFQHTIICNICYEQWSICLSCKKRFSSSKTHEASLHFSSRHNIGFVHEASGSVDYEPVSQRPANDFTTDNGTFESSIEDNNMSCDFNPTNPPSTSAARFDTTSHLFFNDSFQDTSTAVAGMVARAYTQTFQSSIHGVTSSEAAFHLKTTAFLSKLPSRMHSDFIDIIQLAKQGQQFQSTRLPKSLLEIDKFYLKSKYCMMEQLPVPTISIKDDHAYVSLISIIDHFLAFGNKPELSEYALVESNKRSITNCKLAHELYSDVHATLPSSMKAMVLYLTLWSDDFEATSLRKNVHSTWIKTVSISQPNDATTSTKYNYILAIGRKNMDHDCINQQINDELEELGRLTFRYYGKLKKNIPVVVKVLALSADRPERCTMNHILNHAGLNTRRWRYSGYINQRFFPACNACTSLRIRRIKNNQFKESQDRCRYCCNWNFMSKSRHVLVSKPNNYPQIQHERSPTPPLHREVKNITHIRPVEITYDWIKQGCRFCFCNVYYSTWNIQTATTYLTSLGVNHEFGRKHVIDIAIDLRQRKPDDEDIYTYLKFPPMWNGLFTMAQNIDTPMHLLFQGIIKSVFDITFEWLKLHGKKTSFCKYIDTTLQSIKELQCLFCRTETLQTGKENSTSGWIAEHYLGASRILLHLFASVRNFVHGEYSQDIDAFEFMIQTCICFISRIMSNTEVSIYEIDDYIKLFLTSVHNFEVRTYVQDSNRDYSWFAKGNYLSLLNLTDQINTFGHIRNYWEGSRERYIQLVKPFMKNNRNTASYLQIQLKNVLSQTILSQVEANLSLQETSQTHYARYSRYRRYRSLNDVLIALEYKEPIQCVTIKDDDGTELVCTVTGRTAPFTLHAIICNDHEGFNHCGLYYCPIHMKTDSSIMVCETIEDLQKKTICGVMCVCFVERQSYMLFNDDWLYRYEDGKFSLPSFVKELNVDI